MKAHPKLARKNSAVNGEVILVRTSHAEPLETKTILKSAAVFSNGFSDVGLIVEISYSRGQWNYPVEEPLGRLYLAEATFFELFRVQGKMFLLHSIDSSEAEVLENKFATTFCVIDDETEAVEKFLQEVQRITNDRGIDLKTCHATEELKPTLRKYRELLAKSPSLQSLAEQIIEKCPRSPKVFY